MYMRLGFAVAIHVDPDVLLVDEVLAVGDEGFTHKCLDKFAEFKRRGKTILLVTHSLGLVERFCDEALWLDAGRMQAARAIPSASSAPTSPTSSGRRSSSSPPADAKAQESARRSCRRTSPRRGAARQPGRDRDGPPTCSARPKGRWGSREVEITDVALVGDRRRSRRTSSTRASRSTCASACARRCRSTTSSSASASSTPKASAATARTPTSRSSRPSALARRRRGRVRRSTRSIWSRAPTSSTSPSTSCDGYPYDYHRLLYTFRVKSRTKDVGIYRPRHRWQFAGDVDVQADRRSDVTVATSSTTPALERFVRDARARRAGAIVFTNGVFDLLHPATCATCRRRARRATC